MSNTSKVVVLIADDEPSTVAMLSSHLRSKGYSVLEASDGDQAWELAHEHLPHLVILDVMMPGMSGWEVCRKIREAVSLAHTGVIMLTGIGESLNEMTSPLYGADAHVDKPFEFAMLDEKIRETLEHRKQGALGRPDGGADDASMAIEEDDLPTLPPKAKRAPKVTLPKPLAKTRPAAEKAPAPKKAPVAKAPAPKKAPVAKAAAPKNAPVAKAPAKKAPVAKAPAKKAPVAKAPAKKAPVAKAPAKKAPAKKAPAKKAPAKKAPVAKAPAKKAPAKKAPVAKAPAKKAPAKKAPAKKAKKA